MNEKELLEILDPSLICFADKLMQAAKEGYVLDEENYPALFGGLYHCKVARPLPAIKGEPTKEEPAKQSTKPGPKPKKAVE